MIFFARRPKRRSKFVRRHGIRWIPNWRVARLLGKGSKKTLFYERLIKCDMVRRWFLLKAYFRDIRRRREDRRAKYLIFKEVKNNIMCTLIDFKGRVLLKKSSGEVGFVGSKRNSSYAAHAIGVAMGKIVEKVGLRKVGIKIKGRVTNKARLFYRGFFRVRIRIGKVAFRYSHLHESFKVKKERRV
jgi:ribosomal protein S11